MKHFQVFIGKKEIRFLHIISGIFFLAGFGLLIWFFANSYHQSSDFSLIEDTPDETQTPCVAYRSFDGVCVYSLAEKTPKLVAVMIENHVDARPQSGLAKAAIVYEAPVESNITRFMAIFPMTDTVTKVGPVRSARPYYLDWLGEFGEPMYMHVGGSPDALTRLKSGEYFDFNEFYRGDYFWRSRDRYAPHNVYTSSEQWARGWEDFGSEDFAMLDHSWKFGDIAPCDLACTTTLVVSFLPPTYQAEWRYSSSTEKYARYQMRRPHVDQDGTQISADTIVVQKVSSIVLDAEARIEIDTMGSGEALVFTKGTLVEGTWKKTARSAKTRFYDKFGNEIPFTPGKIWIEVVNQVGGVEYR